MCSAACYNPLVAHLTLPQLAQPSHAMRSCGGWMRTTRAVRRMSTAAPVPHPAAVEHVAVPARPAPASVAAATTTSTAGTSIPPLRRKNLLSFTLPQLESELASLSPPLPRFRARQLLQWVYGRGARSVHAMGGGHNFGPALTERLASLYEVDYGALLQSHTSVDQTRKLLVGFPSAAQKASATTLAAAPPADKVECVYIPMKSDGAQHEGAVCVSSQVGCSLSCTFCHTGTMDKKRLRNLTTAEIIGQVMLTQHSLGDFALGGSGGGGGGGVGGGGGGRKRDKGPKGAAAGPATPNRSVSTIVFMGMGEPLYNYRNVRGALDVLTSHPRFVGGSQGAATLGLGFGRPRVTVSTSGVVPGIDALREDFGGSIALAISLHACNDKLRDEIVPLNRTFPLATLMDAVRRYQESGMDGGGGGAGADSDGEARLGGLRRITFEYVMLRGVNDGMGETIALARTLHGITALVNLIPFNPWPGSPYESSEPAHIVAFAAELQRLGVPCTIRWPRGRDIDAACGQLAVKAQQADAVGLQQQRAHP